MLGLSSLVVLVAKMDGDIYFYVDYQKQDITKKVCYPLSCMFSMCFPRCLDLRGFSLWTWRIDAGRWNVTKIIKKRLFSIPNGIFQFIVMLIGICNELTTFERLMNLILPTSDMENLSYVPGQCCCYWNIHKNSSCDEQLKLSLKKGTSIQKEVWYVGPLGLSNSSVWILMNYTLENLSTPKTEHNVWSFLAFCILQKLWKKGLRLL